MSFHPATRTRFYRSLKKQVLDSRIKDRWPEIGKNLVLLKDNGNDVVWKCRDLALAFTWDESPQGNQYWFTIFQEAVHGWR